MAGRHPKQIVAANHKFLRESPQLAAVGWEITRDTDEDGKVYLDAEFCITNSGGAVTVISEYAESEPGRLEAVAKGIVYVYAHAEGATRNDEIRLEALLGEFNRRSFALEEELAAFQELAAFRLALSKELTRLASVGEEPDGE